MKEQLTEYIEQRDRCEFRPERNGGFLSKRSNCPNTEPVETFNYKDERQSENRYLAKREI